MPNEQKTGVDTHVDADLISEICGLTIGVIGYGNQGRAQALNLRDAGCDVLVGARADRASAGEAALAGFRVMEPRALADACDLIALLTPDQTHGEVLATLQSGRRLRTLVLAHGYTLRFTQPPIPADWDVLLVAPSGPGTSLRRDGLRGNIPALIGVYRDRSGAAWARVRAYAVAAGCSGDALLRTTVEEEAEVDLFGEQAVLCGGLTALVTAAWETLVARGYDPAVAYLECVHQVGLTSDMITRYGVAGMRSRISPIALYGDLTRGPRLIDANVRARMAEILEEIRTGRFAREWASEVAAEFPKSRAGLTETSLHPMEKAGMGFRKLVSRVADKNDNGEVATR